MDVGAEFIFKLNLRKPAQSLTYYLTQNLLLIFLSRVTNRLQRAYGSTSSRRASISHIHRQPNLNFAHQHLTVYWLLPLKSDVNEWG